MENKIYNKKTHRYLKKNSAYYKRLVNDGWHMNDKGEFSPPSQKPILPESSPISPKRIIDSPIISPQKSPSISPKRIVDSPIISPQKISPQKIEPSFHVMAQKVESPPSIKDMKGIMDQFTDYLSVNDLLSLYLSSKEQQNILNDVHVINRLNNKYNININTNQFPVWYQFYVSQQISENVRYLYTMEETRYMDKINILSGEVTEEMIMILFDWLYQVRKTFRLNAIISGYTQTLLYVFLTKYRITREKLQLYGLVCLHFATVMFDENPPEFSDYVYLADKAFNQEEFNDAVTSFMTEMNGQLIYPSPVLFIDRTNIDVTALTILSSMLLGLVSYKPSLIAETCTYMITGNKSIYSTQEIAGVCTIITEFLQKSKNTSLGTIKHMINTLLFEIKYPCGDNVQHNIITKLKYNEPWHLGDFDKIRVLGEGAYGKVKSVKRKQCGTEYAVKTSDVEEEGRLNATFIEIGILTALKGEKNIIQLCSFDYTENKLKLVLPLFDSNLKNIKVNDVNGYFKQILEAAVECHRYDVIHRDIKVDNIVIKNNKVVLIDFGISLPFQSFNNNKLSSMANTINYRPPECLFDKDYNYNQGVDIWAIGCVFYYLITGTFVSDGVDVLGDIFRIFGTPTINEWPGLSQLTNVNKLPKFVGTKAQVRQKLAPYDNLVFDCLTMDPTQRPTAKQLLAKYYS
jgi:hypothetical protein